MYERVAFETYGHLFLDTPLVVVLVVAFKLHNRILDLFHYLFCHYLHHGKAY